MCLVGASRVSPGPSDLKLKSVDINEILDHSVRFIEQDAKIKDVEIKLTASTDLPLVPIDADLFFQALLNL
jgi:K+-sensing histidine kinase KdpD